MRWDSQFLVWGRATIEGKQQLDAYNRDMQLHKEGCSSSSLASLDARQTDDGCSTTLNAHAAGCLLCIAATSSQTACNKFLTAL
jgi:hypothetical protein